MAHLKTAAEPAEKPAPQFLKRFPMTETEFRNSLELCGLSQRQFALLLGLEQSTVNRWATGKNPVPTWAIAYLELYEMVHQFVNKTRPKLGQNPNMGQAKSTA